MPQDATPRLPTDEIAVNWTMTTRRTSRKAGSSRAENVTCAQLTLIHRATQLQVVGEVPAGHYSKTEMQTLKEALHCRLLTELARLVAQAR